mgnify:CR=1 FL=1
MIKALIDLAKELKLDYNEMNLEHSTSGLGGVYFSGSTSISPFSLGAVAHEDVDCSIEQFIGHMREAAVKSVKLPFTVSDGYSCHYSRSTDSISIYTTSEVVTLDADDITNLYNVVS